MRINLDLTQAADRIEKRRIKPSTWQDLNPRPQEFCSECVCSTAVLQPLPKLLKVASKGTRLSLITSRWQLLSGLFLLASDQVRFDYKTNISFNPTKVFPKMKIFTFFLVSWPRKKLIFFPRTWFEKVSETGFAGNRFFLSTGDNFRIEFWRKQQKPKTEKPKTEKPKNINGFAPNFNRDWLTSDADCGTKKAMAFYHYVYARSLNLPCILLGYSNVCPKITKCPG